MTPEILTLAIEPLSEATFAPYGHVISGAIAPGRPINHGSSQRVDMPGALALSASAGEPALAVFRAQAQKPDGPWQEMERHQLGTQTFIPLRGARCVVLVALGDAEPDPATLAAFMVSGSQGITLGQGTWHHPLIALDDGDFVVLERRGPEIDCEVRHLATPVCLR